MRKNVSRAVSVVLAIVLLCGCAEQVAPAAPAPVVQGGQMLLPDLEHTPANEVIEPQPEDPSDPAEQQDPKVPAEEKEPAKQPAEEKSPADAPVQEPENSPPTVEPGPAPVTPPAPEPPTQPDTPPEAKPPVTPDPPAENPAPSLGQISIRYGGQTITGDTAGLLAHVVQNEVGGYTAASDFEMLKAMVVATYSYIKFYNDYLGSAPSTGYKETVTSNITNAVNAVLGQAVYYNGKYANCTYFSISAGCTTTAKSYWGVDYPYLISVDSAPDLDYSTGWSKYSTTKEIPAATVAASLGLILPEDPSGWFTDVTHSDGLYIATVKVGGVTKTGRAIREALGLRSHAFEVSYDADKSAFIFTTYGYGHGVGMSQAGALHYSRQGWSYTDILAHYYPGTTVH